MGKPLTLFSGGRKGPERNHSERREGKEQAGTQRERPAGKKSSPLPGGGKRGFNFVMSSELIG